MRVSFFGASREVTGANFLLETAGKKLLLDCGIFQGSREAESLNYDKFSFDPKYLDFVIVGHAHLDHTGRLPKLVKEGFSGKIFATAPTKELAELVLEDNYKLMSEEAQRDNHKPLYGLEDLARTMQLFELLSWNETVEISPGLKITFRNAGHILGSSTCLVASEGKKIIYTSDLGNKPATLLNPPDIYDEADYLICESTYGGRIHEDSAKRVQMLSEIISSTIAKNSVLMIPSFAIERTQELLHDIDKFCDLEGCIKPAFFLDSPLASKATAVFKKYPDYLGKKLKSENPDSDFFGLGRIKITSTVEESKAINDYSNPKVIIAGSGMMNGGRILHHMRRYLPNSDNTLLIVGYLARGSLGRRIIDGQKEIRIFGETIKVNAKVKKIGSYSAHADMPQIIEWISIIKSLKKVFIIHGESDQSLALAKTLKEQLNLEALAPQKGESYEL